MENRLGPTSSLGGRSTTGAELSAELSTLLRSGRTSLQNVQTGLNKVLTLDPLTTVKDLVIVGDGPAAEEIFRYCEDQTVRGYRFRGIFNDEAIDGVLGERRVGDVEAVKSFTIQNRIDILYCALPGTRRAEITDLMEFCECNTIRFRVMVFRSQNSIRSVMSARRVPGRAQYRISIRFWMAKALAASTSPMRRSPRRPSIASSLKMPRKR